MENKTNNSGAGKGDKPRNCFSKKYRDNYDSIDWGKKENDNKKNTDTSDTTNQ